MIKPFDKRINAFRDDLADVRLKGRIEPRRFVEGRLRQIRAGVTPLRNAPRPDAALDSELIYGERVRVFEEAENWAWVQSETDAYVGYVPSDALGETGAEPTHRVSASATYLFPEADIKKPPIARLPFGARIAVIGETGPFVRVEEGFVWRAHVALADQNEPDHVAVAERFLGVPYLWGGRTSLGIDCSALVQIALASAGIAVPRDTDLQHEVGSSADPFNLKYGDLVFWPGHVGLIADRTRLLHASGSHMAVVSEIWVEARMRIGPVSVARTLR